MGCGNCGAPLQRTVADLGLSPLSNDYRPPGAVEERFPLVALVCERCLLVQVPPVVPAERIFSDYAYFSSYSETWLEHVERFADAMARSLHLGAGELVVEVGSNDGHLLKAFQSRGVRVLGIDPAANVTEAARASGVETITSFFGTALAEELLGAGMQADLLVANNVMPHVPDLPDFVAGLARLLAPTGHLSIEFAHLQRLIEDGSFDTIYHEHFSYFSLLTAQRVLRVHGLAVVDVERLATHAGSLRLHCRHEAVAGDPAPAVAEVLAEERARGFHGLAVYEGIPRRLQEVRTSLRTYLWEARNARRRVVGYGAPAKATTLLNFCEVGPELLAYTVDRNLLKQGCTIPGTGIPIHEPARMEADRPDDVLILPWNLRDEIAAQLAPVRDRGARLVVPGAPMEILA